MSCALLCGMPQKSALELCYETLLEKKQEQEDKQEQQRQDQANHLESLLDQNYFKAHPEIMQDPIPTEIVQEDTPQHHRHIKPILVIGATVGALWIIKKLWSQSS